jgi:hypothetical protein
MLKKLWLLSLILLPLHPTLVIAMDDSDNDVQEIDAVAATPKVDEKTKPKKFQKGRRGTTTTTKKTKAITKHNSRAQRKLFEEQQLADGKPGVTFDLSDDQKTYLNALMKRVDLDKTQSLENQSPGYDYFKDHYNALQPDTKELFQKAVGRHVASMVNQIHLSMVENPTMGPEAQSRLIENYNILQSNLFAPPVQQGSPESPREGSVDSHSNMFGTPAKVQQSGTKVLALFDQSAPTTEDDAFSICDDFVFILDEATDITKLGAFTRLQEFRNALTPSGKKKFADDVAHRYSHTKDNEMNKKNWQIIQRNVFGHYPWSLPRLGTWAIGIGGLSFICYQVITTYIRKKQAASDSKPETENTNEISGMTAELPTEEGN